MAKNLFLKFEVENNKTTLCFFFFAPLFMSVPNFLTIVRTEKKKSGAKISVQNQNSCLWLINVRVHSTRHSWLTIIYRNMKIFPQKLAKFSKNSILLVHWLRVLCFLWRKNLLLACHHRRCCQDWGWRGFSLFWYLFSAPS